MIPPPPPTAKARRSKCGECLQMADAVLTCCVCGAKLCKQCVVMSNGKAYCWTKGCLTEENT